MGRNSFTNGVKGKITNEEWKELRSNTLYSRGDQSKKGNLNTRIVFNDQDQHFYLEVANPLLVEKGKNSPRLRFKLRISDKYFAEIVDIVLPTTVGENSKGKLIEEYKVYSVEIKRKKERYYVHITYDVDEVGSELTWSDKITSDYIAGIDVNIDRVAVSDCIETRKFARVQNLLLS